MNLSAKFSRRPSARTPSKPYDRPSTALRCVRGGWKVAGERGGWMSKLLDPASRLIASGASKLFGYMFRKRLTAPSFESGISDKDLHSGADVSQRTSTISMIASSPAEVAKAYMGSMPSKDSSLSGSLRDQVFNEKANSKHMASDPRCLDHSVAPRSVIRCFGISDQHQCQNHVYMTTKLVGRSVMYKLSRSTYFKVHRATSTKVGEKSRDGHSSPVSSQWKSRRRLALKRGITALDDEYGFSGPIRRIRQKSNSVSPSRINNSTTSMQKSLCLEGRRYGSTNSETAEDRTEKNITMLPVQSSEKSHKLFQQLDKLLSSPKERPSELKAIGIDGSPSKLTLDMLRGSALKSMEDIRSSKNFSTQEVGKPVIVSSQQNGVTTPSKSENMDEESKFPRNQANYGMDMEAPQANSVTKTTLPSKNVTKPAPLTPKKLASSSVSIPASEMPAFRISVPEDSFDMSDDEDEFAFPIASDTSAQSQPPPTPTMWTPLFKTQGEEFRVEATLTTSNTTTNAATMAKSEEALKTEDDVLKSPATAASVTSTTSTPASFSFGTSASAPFFGSSTSSSAPFQFWLSGSGFMFGSSASGSTSTPSSFTFNPSSSSTPAFGSQKPAFGFGANSQGAAAAPDFMFGSPAPTFSFGEAQNPMVQQPFQPVEGWISIQAEGWIS